MTTTQNTAGPKVIEYQICGRAYTFGGLNDGALALVLPDIEAVDPAPVIVADGLAKVRERLPTGARVRCDRHWMGGKVGTVTETCDLPGYAQWPPSGPTAWMLAHDGASVCVRFDRDEHSSWWPVRWIQRMT
jgi:hypothetical protein